MRDAAYESLLKSRRQELHGKIARVIEERFSAVKETEPELLAHHYTEAKQFEKAIPLWHRAGALALKRMALAEAIQHLQSGLNLITAFPQSANRDGWELDLRIALTTAFWGHRGAGTAEIRANLRPALALAKRLDRCDVLSPVLYGLAVSIRAEGHVAESLGWIEHILEAAETYGDPAILVVGHSTAGTGCLFHGEFARAQQHHEQLLSLYSENEYSYLAGALSEDPKSMTLWSKAIGTWILGLPDKAIALYAASEAHARQLAHPFNLSVTLTLGAMIFDLVREPQGLRERAVEAARLGRKSGLEAVWRGLAPALAGVGRIRQGEVVEGVDMLRRALEFFHAGGSSLNRPCGLSVLAEGTAQLGDLDGALASIDEAIEQVERPGWEERYYYAEILRIKGGLLLLKGDIEGAERSYVASLECARHQQAKSWELRTATSYARLMRDQGCSAEAHNLLAPIYAWFTEGFDTHDLKEAQALLEQLAPQKS